MPRPVMTREQTIDLEKSIIQYMPSLILMEQAGQTVAAEVEKYVNDTTKHVVIFCGPGNNGGDGFVVARALARENIQVDVYILAQVVKYSSDAQTMLSSLAGYPSVSVNTFPENDIKFGEIVQHLLCRQPAVYVDALFGIGLKRDVTGEYAKLIQWLNEQKEPIISIDIPSGIDANDGSVMGIAVQATKTVSFFSPKLGHVLYPGRAYKGELVMYLLIAAENVNDIAAYENTFELMTSEDLCAALKARPAWSHKGNFGSGLVIGGIRGYVGASYLCSKAALNTGIGRLTVALSHDIAPVLWSDLPEAMCRPYSTQEEIEQLFEDKNAIVIGPGLGQSTPESNAKMIQMACSFKGDVVVDADGLRYLEPSFVNLKRDPYIILTPHPKEMGYLMDMSTDEVLENLIDTAVKCSETYNAVVVLKGATSIIATPSGQVSINVSGGPMLSKGGSGDVLSGIILGFLAQGYDVYHAARYGALLLGEAASTVKKHEVSVLPTDVIEGISVALRGAKNRTLAHEASELSSSVKEAVSIMLRKATKGDIV